MASVAAGEAFMLQGGDCAETFDGVTAANIQGKLRTLLSMAVVLTYAAQVPIVKVGRIAGQFAKPRSSDTETRDGVTLPAYRGDAVNGFAFTAEARTPDPERLLSVYHASAATLNLTRAFVTGGFAHLRSVHSWNADFVKNSAAGVQLPEPGERDRPGAGVHGRLRHRRRRLPHRRLLLQPRGADPGVRARPDPDRLPDPAAVRHLRASSSGSGSGPGSWTAPTSSCCGTSATRSGSSSARPRTADTALELADRLDPEHQPGRITFITRMGAGRIRDVLPDVVAKVTRSGRQVAWVCDPMHGNTFEARNGYKTRAFSDVMEELNGFFDVHEELGTWPGGVHVELTGDDVTECVGGSDDLVEADLVNRYETLCDPRLNRNQSLELAFLVAERLTTGRIRRANPVQAYSPLPF